MGRRPKSKDILRGAVLSSLSASEGTGFRELYRKLHSGPPETKIGSFSTLYDVLKGLQRDGLVIRLTGGKYKLADSGRLVKARDHIVEELKEQNIIKRKEWSWKRLIEMAREWNLPPDEFQKIEQMIENEPDELPLEYAALLAPHGRALTLKTPAPTKGLTPDFVGALALMGFITGAVYTMERSGEWVPGGPLSPERVRSVLPDKGRVHAVVSIDLAGLNRWLLTTRGQGALDVISRHREALYRLVQL